MYAILSHGGRQHRVTAGDRLVVDRLDAEAGSLIALEPVLLTAGDGATTLGDDVEGVRVAVAVIRHLRGRKLRVFKYKPKKRSRKVAGHRSDLTELRVVAILARGDALPDPASAATTDGHATRSLATESQETETAEPEASTGVEAETPMESGDGS